MSDWFDENGDPLGEWEVITEAEYRAIIDRPATDWWVFASNTDPCGRGEIYTAWGQDGEAAPRVDHRCIFEPPAPDHERLPKPTRCVYRKFRVLKEEEERAAAVAGNQEEESNG